MHIALWSPAWPLEKHPNGIVTYVHAMKRGLEERGHRASIFTANGDQGSIEVKQSAAHRLLRKDFASAIVEAILREHRRNPIDVIEMEESFGWCADVADTGIPLVVKLHGPAFLTTTSPARDAERIEREGRALARCSLVVSPSRATLERTLSRYGLRAANTEVVVNPVISAESAWHQTDRKTILFVGRFDLIKGADVVLKAMETVWKNHPDATLTFVGPEGTLPSPLSDIALGFWNYCATLYRPAQRDQIICLGRRPHKELTALRASAAVTVVASRWESYGYTLLEAMGQGCPVVSTDAGACPEAIEHGKTGLLARSEDPEDFARKICMVLSNPEGAAMMGAAARERVLERYSLERAVDATLECYQRAISAHPAQRRASRMSALRA